MSSLLNSFICFLFIIISNEIKTSRCLSKTINDVLMVSFIVILLQNYVHEVYICNYNYPFFIITFYVIFLFFDNRDIAAEIYWLL